MTVRVLTLLAALMLAPSHAHASSATVVTEEDGRYPLGLHLDILEDREGTMSLEDVASSPDGRFIPFHAETPNLGFSSSALWLRMKVENASGAPQNMVLQQFSSWIDEMDLYLAREDGSVQRFQAGEKFPFYQREIINPHFLFPVDLDKGETLRIYLRVKSVDPIQLPLTLWKKRSLESHLMGLTLYFGAVFGCMMAIFLYNLLIYISLKDRNYLCYVAYIAALLFMIFTYTGYSYQFIWPDFPGFQGWVVFPSGFLSMFLGMYFTKDFLETRRTTPRAHSFLTVFQAFCVAVPVAGLWAGQAFTSFMCVATAMVYPITQAAVGVLAYINRVRAARFFIIAWSFSMLGILYTMVTVMGLYTSTTLSRRSMELGLTLDAILLSFALADKIRILRREKETAEALANAALAASNEELEAKVAERTAELKAAKDRAEEATALKDKFVSLVSHDLRAPIGAIIGLLRGAMDNPAMAPEKRDGYLRRSASAAERLMEFIDHILNISRLRSGSMVPSKSIISARAVALEAQSSLESLAMEKGIGITNSIPADCALLADRSLARTVFSNLISNAIKFLHKEDTLKIYQDPGEPDTIVFEDDGPGVAEAYAPDLFRQEMKTSSTGTGGERGTGMGLPHCHEIMAAHGGYIKYFAGEPGGAVFKAHFPRPARLALLVDDQPAQRIMIKSAILKAGAAGFIEAAGGLEALEALKLARPEVIITDVNMPGMSGMELLERIKSSQQLKSIPVIVATSVNGVPGEAARLRDKAMRLGAADFALKPVEEDFGARVWRILNDGAGGNA